jgi:predicted transcriptional regulator
MKNRSTNDISSIILELAIGGRLTKSKIMYKAFVSYAQLKEYLGILQERGLLEYQETKGTYMTTDKGLNFLKIYDKMDKLTPNVQTVI